MFLDKLECIVQHAECLVVNQENTMLLVYVKNVPQL
jgi:hypothetical protein